MGFYISIFFCNLLIPLIMIIGGYFMCKNPPKNINGVWGYKTEMAKKNQSTWEFAHRCCGRLWMKFGAVMLALSVLVQLPFAHSDDDSFGALTIILEGIQIVFLLITIYIVEKKLKQNFDKDGNKRQ